MGLNEEKQQELKPDGWQFMVNISIIAPPKLHQELNDVIQSHVLKGEGHFSDITQMEVFDESFDEFLNCEAYGVSCSLQPYLRDLEKYGVIKALFSEEELSFKYVLALLTGEQGIITFIKKYSAYPNKVRNYTADIIRAFDDIPVWGLFYQILILEGLCYWCKEARNKIGEGKDGYNDVLELWDWIEERLMEKLMIFTYKLWGDDDKKRLKPLCGFLYSTELGRTLQEYLFDKPEPDTPEPQLLPDALNTERAKKYFPRAVEAGYMERTETGHKWKGKQVRLGYFVYKTYDTPRPFVELEKHFNEKRLSAPTTQASYKAKRTDVIQWRADMDNKIFFD